jgi:hypothetical protein
MKRIRPLIVSLLFAGLSAAEPAQAAESVLTPPGADLQAVLDAGDDLLLQPGATYEIEAPLRYIRTGQRIATHEPESLADYARLRLSNRAVGQLINGNRLDEIVLEQVILDGNRYRLSSLPIVFGKPPLVFFGGHGAEGQVVRRCVFMHPRTWSTLKVHEGGSGILVENNIFLGAGHDVRGNGREAMENPHLEEGGFWYNWGDGISCAARETTVRNNLILDPTDVGIVFFGAPGSVAEENVIATISRESLGGINLVDPLDYYAFEDDPKKIDYRGTVVNNNWLDARGGRIHMAIPVGATPWVPTKDGFTFVGGSVTDNLISGGAAAYGILLSGVEDFTVTGNRTEATYSGIAEGLHRDPPDDPGPFLYEPGRVTNSIIQSEFKPAARHLKHLLRCNHLPRNPRGYRDYPYSADEAAAVVRTAYEEMLGRAPEGVEFDFYVDWLRQTRASADRLRRSLMTTPEFVATHGAIDPADLHLFRETLWFNALSAGMGALKNTEGAWMEAKVLYRLAWDHILKPDRL